MEHISPHLSELYEGYFGSDRVLDHERILAAIESVDAIVSLGGTNLGNVIDVGAGDGVVSAQIDKRGLARAIVAAEISSSGIAKMRQRKFSTPFSIEQVDGYKLPFENNTFDTAVCAHVIEHVEHERIFLREIARVSSELYLIAPLEGGMRGTVDRRMGHINYYSPMILKNLVETSGFAVSATKIFAASLSRERIISGPVKGTIKNTVRKFANASLGSYAPHLMAHVMAIRAIPQR